MDTEFFISIVAIVTPFLFVLAIIKMVMNSEKREKKEDKNIFSDREFLMELEDLSRRIDNLEIILRNRDNNRN
jgi:hypothetical protein